MLPRLWEYVTTPKGDTMGTAPENQESLWRAIDERVKLFRRTNQNDLQNIDAPDWTAIAEDLNKHGIVTARGKRWIGKNVSSLYLRRKDQYQSSGNTLPPSANEDIGTHGDSTDTGMVEVSHDATTTDDNQKNTTQAGNDYHLEHAFIRRLETMLNWFESAHPTGAVTPEYRPRFAGTVRSAGLKLKQPIFEAAMAKARQEPQRVGRSFNSLVEMLLWEYAGSPTDLVEQGPTADTGDTTVPEDASECHD